MSTSHTSMDRAVPLFDGLIARVRSLPPVATAVVWPCEAVALQGALMSLSDGLITPVLIGERTRLAETARQAGLDISGCEIVEASSPEQAAGHAVALAASHRVHALLKGSVHTDVLMTAVLAPGSGLSTQRRMSHVFVLAMPGRDGPLFVTDAAINIAPDLLAKRDIVQNAIDLHHALGFGAPRVALLSAVETVNPRIQGTIDAACLCKMADRGQITGGVLDGPLGMDNAVDADAARIKGIVSPVAGRAQILVAPDLEAGNMLAKNLIYMGKADAAGLVLGARLPIVLTSRADGARARLASTAIAALYVHATATARGVPSPE
ncbi:bifunctional enoyl-CoA hydratase/phosphate acetyltransferase [Ameyamaea chiangmaiensis]|uniref:Bifunctional enoyl-CoA hydratase/phosphate acetyltransferase n=1 Tax=Ameyamaea chiangmaiensis TaxID=442969 RepID=A0A850PGX2_9PROT|nr:bifunctional enoyl-CoA hydratase/phosphate acetyltransferase [Ameyamaea chiangmaiensis]NVN40411.1 bifunctional enoyl-CoA hydratase/phosphate acetyltransferase [Ameyamaea chiangmaiensis]